MKNYLLVFEKSSSRLLKSEAFVDRTEALSARFAAEKSHRGNADIEVVVLRAENSEALRQTHARYFNGVDSLLRGAVAAAATGIRNEPASKPERLRK